LGAIESIRDITESKRAKEELENSLRFLEILINTIPSPIFYKDRQGRYIGCNESFASQILGLPKEGIIVKSVFDLSDVIPTDLAVNYQEMDKWLFQNRSVQVYETQVQCSDGIRRDFLFTMAPFNNFAGDVAGIVGVMLDITERKRGEERLQESKDYLDKIINSIGDPIFVKNRQHQFV
jgi:PAS domain S-box-containing protein